MDGASYKAHAHSLPANFQKSTTFSLESGQDKKKKKSGGMGGILSLLSVFAKGGDA